MKSKGDLLSEIDETIDQLIRNSTVLKKIEKKKEYTQETYALEKTQESLLAHLMHMDDLLKNKSNETAIDKKPLLNDHVHQKLGKAGYLNAFLKKTATLAKKKCSSQKKKPKIHKRKVFAKRLP